MKLRRAMAVAAATAVISPAAFLMAPAAFATGPTPSVEAEASASPSPVEEETESAEPTPSADETATTPAEDEEKGEATTAPAPSVSAPAPSASPSTSVSPSTGTSASPSPSEEPGSCEDETDNSDVHTELRGMPSKVVAGSGWKNFTYRVTNKSDRDFKQVEAYVMTEAVDGKEFEDISRFVTVEVDLGDGFESIDDIEGYFGQTQLKAGEYADAPMRLKVDAKAPAGFGVAVTLGVNVTEKNVCEYGDVNIYDFDILAAGTKPGAVDDAEGKPGKPDNKPGPQGGLNEMPVTGTLAETGSSSMLPTIGIAGGVAIVAGAGVVFALKRRNSGATA
ncbi:LPXTG cell wall anchor domain-containing protein [Streptomyces sp. DH12]|uniref:LPXTG cell wall anchor domain-containing protein n=1 Tax=Streptomyces sp. DH12 TaxID=2857010 RepID=UPI001E35BEB9|nr:LPXTG cell wall anchor domain-containing protein [Streptomyces sp. DH12]